MGLLAGGCTSGPAPIIVHETPQESVWLMFDPHAGNGHSHPASFTPEQLTVILSGLRVQGRDLIGGFGLLAERDGAPVFSSREIAALAPHLTAALKKASPKDIATFYVVGYDPGQGKIVTSGGIFTRNGRLYVLLANARTAPGAVQYENTYEMDTRDYPLLPIARFKFTAGFSPNDVRVSNNQARSLDGYDSYLDGAKQVVVDLNRLFTQPLPPPAAGQPRR
jgi:hypothetical protein